MIHIFIGAAAASGFSALLVFARKRTLQIRWWQWALTILAFAYGIFVLEMVFSFLEEGMARGALVMGLVLGLFALIWAVLLVRFVFKGNRFSGRTSS
jgi:hypothetical protein